LDEERHLEQCTLVTLRAVLGQTLAQLDQFLGSIHGGAPFVSSGPKSSTQGTDGHGGGLPDPVEWLSRPLRRARAGRATA
jgi:hypothetical protein